MALSKILELQPKSVKATVECNARSTAEILIPFKSMKSGFIDHLFQCASEIQTLFSGDTLFESGAVDSQHIYLLVGEVTLQYLSGHCEEVCASECLGPLMNIQPRPCKAIAKTDVTILRVDSDQLDRAISWSQIAEYLMSEISLQRDLDEDEEWMKTVLESNLFFKVPPVNAEQIFSRLTPMVVHADEVIVRQGEIGDCCYFIKEGEALVNHYDERGRKHEKLATITVGRCFGEDSLVYEQARNANVIMKTDGVLMRLEKSDFLLLRKEPVVDEINDSQMGELAQCPILIDVRTGEEYAAGHIAFSANIPLNLLSLKKRLLAPEKLYVFYCNTGRRARAAAYLLGKSGYNVIALAGGIEGQRLSAQLVTEAGYILRDGELIAAQ